MKRHHRWLLDEIADWRTEGLIDPEQARKLTARYDQSAGGDWGKLIFTGLGAVIFGLGIILFFAYNWQDMHRFVKLASIGGAVLSAHAAGWWLSRPSGPAPRVGESLHLLGTMLFGAGIWLVAQIYHIDEHYPNAFLVWGLGALSLAWTIPSVAQGLLALALMFLWSWLEVIEFHQPHHWGAWVVAAGVIPLAWRQRSRLLLFFALCAFLALFSISAARVDEHVVFAALFLTSGAYLGLARAAPRTGFPGSATVFQTAGAAVYLVLLFLASFEELNRDLFRGSPDGLITWLYWGGPLALALVGWGAGLLNPRREESPLERAEAGLIVAALGLAVATSLNLAAADGWNWLAFNLLFLAHGALLISSGVRQLRWQRVALGGAMLSALLFARFLDLFDSLLMRSGAFLLLGAGLFLIGLRYSREKQRVKATGQEVTHDS